MSNLNLEELYYEWQNNLEFRQEFKKNPEQALKKAGYQIDAADLEKIKKIFTFGDEKLDKRDNK